MSDEREREVYIKRFFWSWLIVLLSILSTKLSVEITSGVSI